VEVHMLTFKGQCICTERFNYFIDVECIYGFVGWGVLQAKSMTSQRNRAVTRWRICVTMTTLFYIFNSTVID